MKQIVIPFLLLFFVVTLHSQNTAYKTITFERNSETLVDDSEQEFQKWISSSHSTKYKQHIKKQQTTFIIIILLNNNTF